MDKNKKLFPQRLWELIHDEKYNFCLRWSPDGQRVYLNRNDFENHYLKTPHNQFHTQKAISFVRQMNMYGFRKVDDCYYENDNFKRNCYGLLKNMVRRHSNKTFYVHSSELQNNNSHNQQTNSNINQQYDQLTTTVPQHLCLQQQQQQQQQQRNQNPYQYQRQHRQVISNNATVARAVNVIDNEHQTDMVTAAAAAVAAQCLKDAAAGRSIGTIEAALAALNSTQVAAAAAAATLATSTPRSPLASTLYHRLAALNFDQSSEQFLQHRQQQQQASPSNDPSSLAVPIAANLIQDKIGCSIQEPFTNGGIGINQVLSHKPTPSKQQVDLLEFHVNSPQQQQLQSMAARQAAQQDIVRSLLQLKQPQVPIEIQQSLLASLHQNNPSLLLESLASLSSVNQLAQIDQSLSDAVSMSPLELVVNPTSSSTSERRNSNTIQQDHAAINGNTSPLMNLTKHSSINMTLRGGSTGLNRRGLPHYDHYEDGIEINQEDDECTIDFEDEFCRNQRPISNISSSSSNNDSTRHCTQDPEDISSAVLDLAKPSSTRFEGRYRS